MTHHRNNRRLHWLALAISLCSAAAQSTAQRTADRPATPEPATTDAEPAEPMSAQTFRGLELRSIGPALMSGRVSDIVVHPDDQSTWYVAVGSGNVWKTTNAGTTWEPIFDDQGSYSIGCITLDPNNPEVVWVGTGENVGGRHVGYRDGVYRSRDGGKTWENLGLHDSQHIGMIEVDPRDSDTVYVAAEGPLWSPGGDRGLFKTTDGGIDGHGKLRVGIVNVNAAFQCKKWRDTVHRPTIDQFRGATQGRFDQAILMTTARFSENAVAASIRAGVIPIILVDGPRMIDLMIENDIGTTRKPLTIAQLDEGFFADLGESLRDDDAD